MKPLIDADILFYEVGHASEKRMVAAEGTSFEEISIVPQSWEFAQEVFDNRLKLICDEVGATTEPLLFVTESKLVNRILNKKRKWLKEPEVEYKPNFRDTIAKTREYKGNRKDRIYPFHYKNLVNYALSGKFQYEVAPAGIEADDALCIYQMSSPDSKTQTIICSRDKDLKQCLGWHYSWECGKQTSIGPFLVEGLGFITNKNEGKVDSRGKPKPLRVFAAGNKLFYYQLLTGDSSDNIEGVLGRGSTFAYNLLKDAQTERECYELVAEVYVKEFGDAWEERMQEMIDLLWIGKELNEDGSIVKWTKPPLKLL